MSTQPDLQLGPFHSEVKSSTAKVIINFVIAGFLLLIGIPLTIALFTEGAVIGLPGVAAVIGGILLIVMNYQRTMGRAVQVYEQGLVVSVRGKSQSWRFDALDAVRIRAKSGTRSGRVFHNIVAFDFFKGGEMAFTMGPIYTNWNALGQQTVEKVSAVLLPRYIERLQSFEQIVFDDLKSAFRGRSMTIKLDAQGIVESDKDQLLWADVKACALNANDPALAAVTDPKGNRYTAFRLHNSMNGFTAWQIITTMFGLRDQKQA